MNSFGWPYSLHGMWHTRKKQKRGRKALAIGKESFTFFLAEFTRLKTYLCKLISCGKGVWQREGYRESSWVRLKKDRTRGGKKWNPLYVFDFLCVKLKTLCGSDSVWRLEKMTTCFLLSLSSLCFPSFPQPPPLPLLSYPCLFLSQPCCFFCSADFFMCSTPHLPGAQMTIFSQLDEMLIQDMSQCLPLCPSFSFCTYQHFFHLDWTWGPIREKFLDQGKRGEIWEQWAPCQTHLGLLLADKEWVCALCLSTTTPVIMLCFPVMSNVFLRFSPLPHPSPLSPDTMSISILLLCFHQPLKVRKSRIHFPFSSFFRTSSPAFLTLPFLCSEDTLHIYIIQQHCVKTASHTSSWINHPHLCLCVFVHLLNVPMTCCAETLTTG